MALLNSNSFGIPDGFARAGEVALFHIASNALVIIGAAIANYHPSHTNDIKYAYVAGAIALANMVIAGVAKWLTVHGPSDTSAPVVDQPLQASGVQG